MITTLRQSSSAGARIDLSSVRFQCDRTKISNCGLRHQMKLVPFATRVRMDVKAFPSRPSGPLLITNSQRRNSILFMTAMKYSQSMALSNCVSYGSDVFPCHASPRRRLRLCLRANKNLHIPAGNAQSILLHNNIH
ncbi:hypothetical protein T02_13918 [Trichinella nativa]|uniref:Uncharacterized protein n=1 Tax=Trichinella nativa TaxID=6335 RepID=A0A0V1KN88_9BILA|nr:hypothetical protein T02_13918 [Trichinella nativa]